MDINKNVREYLEKNGITQTYVSKVTKIPIKTFNAMMTGKRRMFASELIQICAALKLDSSFF
jgi:hypothetical protein